MNVFEYNHIEDRAQVLYLRAHSHVAVFSVLEGSKDCQDVDSPLPPFLHSETDSGHATEVTGSRNGATISLPPAEEQRITDGLRPQNRGTGTKHRTLNASRRIFPPAQDVFGLIFV